MEVSDTILNKAAEATRRLIPTKSSNRYIKEYELFCQWKQFHKVTNIQEDVLLAYFLDEIIFLLVATQISISLALDDNEDHLENTRKVQLYFQDSQSREPDYKYKTSEKNYRDSRERETGYTQYQLKHDSDQKNIDSLYSKFDNDHKNEEIDNRNLVKEKSFILEPDYDAHTDKYSHAQEHDHDHDELSNNNGHGYDNPDNKKPKTGYIKYQLESKEPKKEQISVRVIKQQKKTVLADRDVVHHYIKSQTDSKEANKIKEEAGSTNQESAYKKYEVKEVRPREKNIFVNVVKEDKQTFLLKPEDKKDGHSNRQEKHETIDDNHEKSEHTSNEKKIFVNVVKEKNDHDDTEGKEQNRRLEHDHKSKSSRSLFGKDKPGNIHVKVVEENKKSFHRDSEQSKRNPTYQSKYRITETKYEHSPENENRNLEGPYTRYNVNVKSPKTEKILVNIVKENKRKAEAETIPHESKHSESENTFGDSEHEYKNSEDSYHEYEDTKSIRESEHNISDSDHDEDHEHEGKYVHEYKSRPEYDHDHENDDDINENKQYKSEPEILAVQNKNPKEKTIFVKVVKPKDETNNKFSDRKHDVVVKIWTKKSK